jgi:hypothetical protein
MQVSKVKFTIKKKLNKKQCKNIRISLLKFNNLKKKFNFCKKASKVKFIIYKKKTKLNKKTI